MGLFRKHGKWYIDYYYHGRRVREAAGTSKRKANAALTARKGEILQGRFRLAAAKPSPLFEVVLKQYEAWAEVNTRSWRFTKNSRVPPLKTIFKGKTLRSITPWLIEKYKAERRESVKPATVNRELAFLSHFFTKAIEWGHATDHPMKGGKVKKVPGEVMRERVLTAGEESRLLAKASEDLRPFLVLALDTGMRFGEIHGLVWDNVDLPRGEVLISQTKNGRPRRLPLTDRARKTLEGLRDRRRRTHPRTRSSPGGTVSRSDQYGKLSWGHENGRSYPDFGSTTYGIPSQPGSSASEWMSSPSSTSSVTGPWP